MQGSDKQERKTWNMDLPLINKPPTKRLQFTSNLVLFIIQLDNKKYENTIKKLERKPQLSLIDAINIYDYRVLKNSMAESQNTPLQIQTVDVIDDLEENIDLQSDKIILIKDINEPWWKQLVSFPLQVFKDKFKPGSIKSSIFALCTAVIGAGLIALP